MNRVIYGLLAKYNCVFSASQQYDPKRTNSPLVYPLLHSVTTCDIVCIHSINIQSELWFLFTALSHDFSETPKNTTTEEDDIARFMCQIESVPKAMISWERNGKPLPHNSRYI
jgi:hypothetical protein